MELDDFIKEYKEEIAEEWVEYARDNISITEKLDQEEVRDHIIEMLTRIANDMGTPQTNQQQETKSKGNRILNLKDDLAAVEHGEQRVEVGFNIVEVSSEFRALRASVLRLWERKDKTPVDKKKVQDLIRFNEAIDEAWMHSVERYHTKRDESKNWFLGILGHDLRNPLSVISGVQQLMKISPNLSDKEKSLLQRTDASIKHMTELINNLLELTKLRLGGGISIDKTSTDLTKLCEQIIQEFEVSYPEVDFQFRSPGPLEGLWDPLRLKQVINNLVANALRHGDVGGPIKLKLSAENDKAILSVNNFGPPIPEDLQEMIFTGMYSSSNGNNAKESSYGLGLYIVSEIVEGHKGEIHLESTAENGTTFTIQLPRQ